MSSSGVEKEVIDMEQEGNGKASNSTSKSMMMMMPEGVTSGGILPYSMVDGQIYVLLGGEVRQGCKMPKQPSVAQMESMAGVSSNTSEALDVKPSGNSKTSKKIQAQRNKKANAKVVTEDGGNVLVWNDFGGKMDVYDHNDSDVLDTVAREFSEETMGLFGGTEPTLHAVKNSTAIMNAVLRGISWGDRGVLDDGKKEYDADEAEGGQGNKEHVEEEVDEQSSSASEKKKQKEETQKEGKQQQESQGESQRIGDPIKGSGNPLD
eukprot:TRINITY_DN3389_c0_g3_i1.p1 TRINITY_DN3389_c0_g3~~TRINITY_DN3389_c0_g3_i1.p1  ORF type:complete len:264 (-),score=91.68 TRINITY_DN3389_c0_g3_i1:254-1045(-)